MSSSDRSMLVEHVSQLSQPDCKFCLKKSHDPGHSDQSRLNMISSGGGYQGIMVITVVIISPVYHGHHCSDQLLSVRVFESCVMSGQQQSLH